MVGWSTDRVAEMSVVNDGGNGGGGILRHLLWLSCCVFRRATGRIGLVSEDSHRFARRGETRRGLRNGVAAFQGKRSSLSERGCLQL